WDYLHDDWCNIQQNCGVTLFPLRPSNVQLRCTFPSVFLALLILAGRAIATPSPPQASPRADCRTASISATGPISPSSCSSPGRSQLPRRSYSPKISATTTDRTLAEPCSRGPRAPAPSSCLSAASAKPSSCISF